MLCLGQFESLLLFCPTIAGLPFLHQSRTADWGKGGGNYSIGVGLELQRLKVQRGGAESCLRQTTARGPTRSPCGTSPFWGGFGRMEVNQRQGFLAIHAGGKAPGPSILPSNVRALNWSLKYLVVLGTMCRDRGIPASSQPGC